MYVAPVPPLATPKVPTSNITFTTIASTPNVFANVPELLSCDTVRRHYVVYHLSLSS